MFGDTVDTEGKMCAVAVDKLHKSFKDVNQNSVHNTAAVNTD